MRSECKGLHRSSTLDAHVLPVAVRKAGDEVKTEPRRRKAMRNIGPDLDQEAKARGQAQLDQRHLEAYRNMHRLRDALCRRYAALLTGKVRSQRARLQRSDEAATAKAQKETKQKQKKLAFTKLQHNDSYLKALPKTSYYLIFDLQKQLAERGHLRSHHDLEDFYRCIRYNCPPSQLHNSLEDVRIRMLESRPAADLMTQHKTSEKHPCTAEDRREEVLSRWRQPTQLLQQGSGPEEIFGGSQMKDENEQMFPKIIPETLETSGKAEIYLRRLRRMHDLCLTNMAFSKRLLDKETDSLSWQEERGNRDLPPRQQVTPNKVTRRQYSFMLPVIDSTQRKTSQTNQPPLCSQKRPRRVCNAGPSHPQKPRTITSARHPFSETLGWDTAVCCRKTPDPLSIEDVCQQKHVKLFFLSSDN
ncbi:uncharacterized protein si:ch211-130h14.4 isoform X2 [Pseudoliparis swirei]|uniref:uncharacterized protein si:ch211-130h14.4 isoform X2 n=1 Tax=Pseudoliparis swirei TaxID=2059687 RepID=UPI0024BED50E|nr:uncharacterized protein si:ch211-130h14.4 isoform X2 [Pseudoliparis swirei]